jgi:hypothetical protein
LTHPVAGDNSKKDDDMSMNSAQNFKEDLVSNVLKCGSLILLAVILIGTCVGFSSELGLALTVSFHWTLAAAIVAKDWFYGGYTYWSWLPPSIAAALVVAHMLVSCVCASMKKKHFFSEAYDRLDTLKMCLYLAALIAVGLYAPVSSELLWTVAAGYIYFGGMLFMRIAELQENERIKNRASQA